MTATTVSPTAAPASEAEDTSNDGFAERVVKRTLTIYGAATAWLRPPPDYLLVGTKRGGTTSLHAYLLEHPGVLRTCVRSRVRPKGLYFFSQGWDRGKAWYRAWFPSSPYRALRRLRTPGHVVVTGEASPYDLFHPLAAARARELAPDARILITLRNPVERAFSHYKERRKNGTETLSFEEALDAEAARCAGEEARLLADPSYVSFHHRHSSYVAQSRYRASVERWLAAFPADQVMVILAEDMYADPQKTYDEVCRFLGLPPHTLARPEQFNAEPSSAMKPETRARLQAELADELAWGAEFFGRPNVWS